MQIRMNQFTRDLCRIFIPAAFIIAVFFFAGFFIGKSRPPSIKAIVMEETADREYIERYRIAGEEGYQFVLHKEYVLEADFIINADIRGNSVLK